MENIFKARKEGAHKKIVAGCLSAGKEEKWRIGFAGCIFLAARK